MTGKPDDSLYFEGAPERRSWRSLSFLKFIANNPKSPPDLLSFLSQHKSDALLERIASNPSCSARLMRKLSRHPSFEVRYALCENPALTGESARTLAADENVDVRYNLAENPHISAEILEQLAMDANPYVAARAARTLQKLARPAGALHRIFQFFTPGPHARDRSRSSGKRNIAG